MTGHDALGTRALGRLPHRTTMRLIVMIAMCAALVVPATTAARAAGTFVVTTTADTNDGTCDAHCSLREAIVAANALAGADAITFDIAGSPPYAIQPLTTLPTITDPVVIDGTSTGCSTTETPRVELDGTQLGIYPGLDPSAASQVNGLHITAGLSTVRGLAINRFSGTGLRLENGGGNTVECTFLGTNASGTAALSDLGHVWGLMITQSPNNLIGGTSPELRNLIAGHRQTNIFIGGPAASGNLVQGNLIGTDITGANDITGGGVVGVYVIGSTGNTIGGTQPGARNVISGNEVGVMFPISGSNIVQGNYIGTNASGTAAVGNNTAGVYISQGANNVVGGSTAAARNVVSGNGTGIRLHGQNTQGTIVHGNYIGTDVTGSVALANGTGVFAEAARDNHIGGTTPGTGNLVSGNQYGVRVSNDFEGNIASGNLIRGNRIGTTAGGDAGVPNFVGVDIRADDNVVGGTAPDAANTIAFNSNAGVRVSSGTGNGILGNLIHSNGALGIDLGVGVTFNDADDVDTGANDLQNFPVLTSFTSSGGTTTVAGMLDSIPSTTFRVEFFSNPTCDPSGFGEGKVFLGSVDVTTDGGGDATIAATVPTGTDPGHVLTATATDPDGNTSEFSGCVAISTANSAPTVTLSGPTATDEGQTETYAYTATDPDGDPLTITESCGDDGLRIDTVAANSFDCTFPDGPATSTVEVIVDDGELGDSDSIEVTISNLAPVITSITASANPAAINTQVNASAVFIDPGTSDTHTCTIDWGDGSAPAAGIVAGGECGGSHSYAAAGVYTLVVTVADDDGDSDSEIFEYVVVYDPDGGFVTGGGWITSPAGAYTPDPSLTGKASFGFVSKYKKGTSVPDGNTQFQFHAAGMNFHSTDYQWLVIAGADAKYKGSGTINGAGDYGFMLTATDGQRAGGGDIDRFRIKIWDNTDGTVLYDNQIGDSDDAEATDAIEGGSIVIHTKK